MTIPAAPLPSWRDVFFSFSIKANTEPLWICRQDYPNVFLCDQGRTAFDLALTAIYQELKPKRLIFLVPAFFCNETLAPLRQHGAWLEIRFYDVDSKLAPLWETIPPSRAGDAQEVFVLMLVHYFGFPNATSAAAEFARLNGLVLIEDAAHLLDWVDGMGLGKFVIFSPHKLLAIPHGAILAAREGFGDALDRSYQKLIPRGVDYIWIIKRLIQKILFGFNISWHQWADSGGSPNAQSVSLIEAPQGSCDIFSQRLLNRTSFSIGRLRGIRRQNFDFLLKVFNSRTDCRPLFNVLPQGLCPYAFPLLVPAGAQAIVQELNSIGVTASRWPDLAPEVLSARDRYPQTFFLFDQLILLPIHQSLSHQKIQWMADVTIKIISRGARS